MHNYKLKNTLIHLIKSINILNEGEKIIQIKLKNDANNSLFKKIYIIFY